MNVKWKCKYAYQNSFPSSLFFFFGQVREQWTGPVVWSPQPGRVPTGPSAESTGPDQILVSPTLTTSCLQCLLCSSASPWRAGWISFTAWVYIHWKLWNVVVCSRSLISCFLSFCFLLLLQHLWVSQQLLPPLGTIRVITPWIIHSESGTHTLFPPPICLTFI